MYLVILTAAISIFTTAQVQFGIKAGLNLTNINLSSVSPNSSISFNSRTDFNAGILVVIPLFSSYYLQPELYYSGQGANSQVAVTSLVVSNDYMNLPVLFKYHHSSGFFAETGPQVSFLISASEKANNQPSVSTQSNTQSVDFSWSFGIGYEIQKINLGIDARYNLGLTNIEKGQYSNGTAKNSVFQFGLFYLFKRL